MNNVFQLSLHICFTFALCHITFPFQAMLYKGCACDTFYLQPLARQAKGNPNKINPALGVITSQKQLDQFFGGVSNCVLFL